jgi:hypothetical protein
MKCLSMVAVAVMVLAGCGGGVAGLALPLASMSVSAGQGSVGVGSRTPLTATGMTRDGKALDVSWAAHWESSNPALVQISGEGSSPEAVALDSGSASVTAIIDDLAASANLQVVSPPTQPNETPAGR